MSKILSIDIGIKNLSFCLFSKNETEKETEKETDNDYKIEKWEIINLNENNEEKKYCVEIDKKNVVCNKEAKYCKNGKYFCLKHSKKTEYMLPIIELSKSKVVKLKINELKELAQKYDIIYENDSNKNKMLTKKTDIMNSINNFINDKILEPIKPENKNKYDIIAIGRNIKKHFDIFFGGIMGEISDVCIEIQMTSKMRIISFMIAEYFIVKNDNIKIKMVSPCYKLKDLETKKTNYSDRKKNSVKHCLDIIKNYNNTNWEDFFNSHKKKDDLSDCFLQGLWYIKNKV